MISVPTQHDQLADQSELANSLGLLPVGAALGSKPDVQWPAHSVGSDSTA